MSFEYLATAPGKQDFFYQNQYLCRDIHQIGSALQALEWLPIAWLQAGSAHRLTHPLQPPDHAALAVVVDASVNAQDLLEAMQSAAIPGLAELALFDVYRGKGIDSDKKSLAFRVLLQDTQKTFTDSEVDAVMAQLTELLKQKFNAQLRS